MKNSLSLSRYIVIYYIALVFAFFYLMRPDTELPLSLRIVMMGLTFAPVVLNVNLLPFSVLCFYGISSSSFCNVLPSTTSYFVIVVLFFYVFIYKRKGQFLLNSLLVYLYFLLIATLHLDFDISLAWILIALLLADIIRDEKGLLTVFYAFIVVSLFLSILYFVHYGVFIRQYGSNELDLEQSGWINPNSFGAAIGAGAVLSAAYLMRVIELPHTKLLNIVSIVIVAVSFVAITLNASRGAFAAFVIPVIIMLMTTKTKLWVKIIIAVFAIGFVFWMLNSNMFELLMVRMGDETFETGGGRTKVWRMKLSAFFNADNSLYFLIGIGQDGCNNLGRLISTHNDFLTSFIAYGIIGFLLFVYSVFVYPFKIASKSNKKTIALLLLYVFTECLVLEPFFRGKIFVLMYYVFTLKYAMIYSDYTINNPQIR